MGTRPKTVVGAREECGGRELLPFPERGGAFRLFLTKFWSILLSLICHNPEVLSGAYKCAEILIKDVLPSANEIFFCPWVLKRPL